ncbi:muconolactone Delta-isomerase family protein [Mesorhizobium sp.]|uniref:muconolactone Delta-isomerase family protein n=1 Tax=Mesorhizobium sp. TaxID=1871066 RepID=UPI0025E3F4CC|nr:muconolactone Delta-isomerase family protein [Mesorhizobium sp.]
MQFFALLARNTQKFSDADFAPLLPGEAEQRRTLYAQGAVRQVWNRGDIPGSGMMFEAVDEKEVRGLLATLPLVETGMMDIAAIVPLNPYPGFGPKR